jgi:hypothetical protein
MEKFMTKDQVKKMFTYMGYGEQAETMYFEDLTTYFRIKYVNGDMKLKSYAEFDKTGNDLEDRKRYIKYYNRTKKINEYRAKVRMYNAYCEKKFSHIDAKCCYNSTDILRAIEEYYKIIRSGDYESLKAGLSYKVRMFSDGLGIGGFAAETVCAYAADNSASLTFKKDKFIRVVHAVREWYKAILNEERIEEYYA